MDTVLRRLRNSWLAFNDEAAGYRYANAARRSGHLDELWERSQLGDHAAAKEARILKKLLGFPTRVPLRDCYVVLPLDMGPLSEENPNLHYFMAYLDGREISNTPLLFNREGYSPLEVQMEYNSKWAWDTAWMRAIDAEHYECPGCS